MKASGHRHRLSALPLAWCLCVSVAGEQRMSSCTSEVSADVSLLQQLTPGKRLAPEATSTKRHAFVSVIYGSRVDEVVSLRVLMASARRHGSTADRLAITPRGSDGLPQEYRDLLLSDGVQVLEVPPIELPVVLQGKALEKSWYGVLNKYHVFNQTQYERIVLLDTDVAFSGSLHPDDVFQACGDADICMKRDRAKAWSQLQADTNNADCASLGSVQVIDRSHFHCFCEPAGNAGVMVVKPSARLFDAFLRAVARETRPFGLPDQQILACFIHEHPELIRSGELSPTWNSCHSPWYRARSAAIVHWCGRSGSILMKPWRCSLGGFCGDMRGPDVQKMWVRELEGVDSCTRARHEEACAKHHACHWCSRYCMDRRIGCSSRLFSVQPDARRVRALFRTFPHGPVQEGERPAVLFPSRSV